MPGVARLGDPIDHGGSIISASDDTLVDGIPVARVGDMVNCLQHGITTIVQGANQLITDAPMTARIGDMTACGATIVSGSTDRIIEGDVGTVPPPPSSALFTKPNDAPVKLDPATEVRNSVAVTQYIANPSSSYSAQAANDGVKPYYPPTPDTTGQVDPAPPMTPPAGNGSNSALLAFLASCLAEAAQGRWRESGQGGKPSNPNIIKIWQILGYPMSGMWITDQTAWCAGFVNFALKMSGLPYLKEAGAQNVIRRAGEIGMTTVNISDMQPGDICLWSYHHVNFCYTAKNGKYSFVGGNQSPKNKGNNPQDGDITNNYTSGWTPAKGGIVAVVRPKF